jgi:recombination protein RecR
MTTELDTLIAQFAKLPGLGPRSARRAVLHLLKSKEKQLKPLAANLLSVAESIRACHICGNMDAVDPCSICADEKREKGVVCVVEDVADVWAIERCRLFKGVYHVLGGTLSAIDGRGPDQLAINPLIQRVAAGGITEIILATNATVEGQTTAHYIQRSLAPYSLTISRLAQGVPMGGELDYLDDGTLGAAFKARLPF